MKTYVALFVLAAALSYVLTPLVRRGAIRWGILDYPDELRRIHARPVPRLGGIAIYASLVLTLAALMMVDNLVAVQFQAHLTRVLQMLAAATLVLLLGLYDDLRGTNARIKFTVQGAAALLLYVCGFQITRLWNPFGGTWDLGPALSLPLTVVWLVGITNAFNLIDGLDGLSAGAALFATVTLCIAALFYHQPVVVIVSIALAGAVVGFLRYNFSPATIFLGDSGSLFLGFLLAALSVEGSQKSTTAIAVAIPLVSFGLPIVDTLWAITRRSVSKRPIFHGDLEHIHHMMLKRGLSRRQALITLYGVCAVLGLLSLLFLNPQGKPIGLALFLIGVSVLVGIQHLGYHEFNEMMYAVGKIFRHHRVLALNVHLRRAVAELHSAETLGDIFRALTSLVETDEFDGLTVLTYPGTTLWAWHRENLSLVSPAYESLSGAGSSVPLTPREGSPAKEQTRHLLWRMHVPLCGEKNDLLGEVTFFRSMARGPLQIDLHHLCTLFSRELGQALQRLDGAERH